MRVRDRVIWEWEGNRECSYEKNLTPAKEIENEKWSEYILAHTGLRELDRHPLGGCGSGFWFSSRLYYPFGKGPGQHIIRCLTNRKCENERDKSLKEMFRTIGDTEVVLELGLMVVVSVSLNKFLPLSRVPSSLSLSPAYPNE